MSKKITVVAIVDAAKIGREAVPVHEAIAHDVVALPLTRHCGVITRDQDLVPDLVHTTSVYVCVSHDNISKGFIYILVFTLSHFTFFLLI